MRKLPLFMAAAAISALGFTAGPSVASPLAGGLTSGAVPQLNEGLVQKVHGWHCRRRYGWYHGHKVWHRHRRACYDDDYDNYDNYDDYSQGYYPYSYGYPYAYGFGGPFIGFSFGEFGGHHRRHHHGNW
jgi:hypothetical protein